MRKINGKEYPDNLINAKLAGEDLHNADLVRADLTGANLTGANLSDADLSGACLHGVDLSYADLSRANLTGTDLRNANLSGADLTGANLTGARCITRTYVAPPEGEIIGWKKCRGGVIVKLRIPASAARSNATTRKCRAEFVEVLEVIGADEGVSRHAGGEGPFTPARYRAGETVHADAWCTDRWQECAGGIHFFITREEAEDYVV
jgi:uncharacterized protein YjbI with pentapeptide repeats